MQGSIKNNGKRVNEKSPPSTPKRKTSLSDRHFGADYVSRCGQLSVVSIVANAQEQEAE